MLGTAIDDRLRIAGSGTVENTAIEPDYAEIRRIVRTFGYDVRRHRLVALSDRRSLSA